MEKRLQSLASHIWQLDDRFQIDSLIVFLVHKDQYHNRIWICQAKDFNMFASDGCCYFSTHRNEKLKQNAKIKSKIFQIPGALDAASPPPEVEKDK